MFLLVKVLWRNRAINRYTHTQYINTHTVYTHVYTCTYTVYILTCTLCVYICTHKHTLLYIYTHTYTYTHVYTHEYIHLYTYAHTMCRCMYIYIHTHCIYMHTLYSHISIHKYIHNSADFPGGSDGKESACNKGDLGSIPGLGRSSGEGNGCPLQYSCLENPMDRGAWLGYSPWDCKELDTTEKLTLSLLLRIEECPGEGSRILECVAVSYSKGSSRPRDWTHSLLHLLHWQAGSFTASATWEAATHSSTLPWRVP